MCIRDSHLILGDSITYSEKMYDTLEGADALLICTEWPEFKQPDFEKVKGLLNAPVVFDGRNLYRPEAMEAEGFTYVSVGRGAVKAG